MLYNKPPEKIYLQYHGDDEPQDEPVDSDNVTWCSDRIFNSDIEYVKSPSDPAGSSASNRIADIKAELAEACPGEDAQRPIHERLVILHDYRRKDGCNICSKCGTAKHKTKYEGFKYWFAGIGYEQES